MHRLNVATYLTLELQDAGGVDQVRPGEYRVRIVSETLAALDDRLRITEVPL